MGLSDSQDFVRELLGCQVVVVVHWNLCSSVDFNYRCFSFFLQPQLIEQRQYYHFAFFHQRKLGNATCGVDLAMWQGRVQFHFIALNLAI